MVFPPAGAAPSIRLEKEVPKSAVTAVPPLQAKIFASRTAASPVAAQSFSKAQVFVSMVTSVAGAPMYRIRLDFSNVAALTRDMNLWWELWLGGSRVGPREPVPQSAWALFAGDADNVGGVDRWIVECQDALGATTNAPTVYAVCLTP